MSAPPLTPHRESFSHAARWVRQPRCQADREHAWLPSMTQGAPTAGPAAPLQVTRGTWQLGVSGSVQTPPHTCQNLGPHDRCAGTFQIPGAQAGRHITESASPFKLQTEAPRPTVKQPQDHTAGSARPPAGVGGLCWCKWTVVSVVSQHRFLQGLMEGKACVNVNFVFECESVCGATDV